MAIPINYIARNLVARRLTTILTAGGMALVVYVFATVLRLAAGLEQTLVSTGQDDNVVVIRRSAQTEVQSGVDRRQASVIETLPDIATGADGQRMISKEPVVLINLAKRSTGKTANVVIRGVTTAGLTLRAEGGGLTASSYRCDERDLTAALDEARLHHSRGTGEAHHLRGPRDRVRAPLIPRPLRAVRTCCHHAPHTILNPTL